MSTDTTENFTVHDLKTFNKANFYLIHANNELVLKHPERKGTLISKRKKLRGFKSIPAIIKFTKLMGIKNISIKLC